MHRKVLVIFTKMDGHAKSLDCFIHYVTTLVAVIMLICMGGNC